MATEKKIALKQHETVVYVPASEKKFFESLGWELTSSDDERLAELKAAEQEKADREKAEAAANAELEAKAKEAHEAAVAEEEAARQARVDAANEGGAFLDDIIGRQDTGEEPKAPARKPASK